MNKYLFTLLIFCTSLRAVTDTQARQQLVKKSLYSAVLARSVQQMTDAFYAGMGDNMGLTDLALMFDNAQQRTGNSVTSVALNYGMTAYDYLPMLDSSAVMVSPFLYRQTDLPPFLVPDCTVFSSIQAALDYLQTATMTAADSVTMYVAEGTYYENIVIPAFRAISCYALGNVLVGDEQQSCTCTWQVNNEVAVRQDCIFGSVLLDAPGAKIMSYPSGWYMSGNFIISNGGVALSDSASKRLVLQDVQMDGQVVYDGSSQRGRTELYFDRCTFNDVIDLNSFAGFEQMMLVQACATCFNKKLGIDRYGRLLRCVVGDGIDAACAITSGAGLPAALIGCSLHGTIHGLDATELLLYVDSNTYQSAVVELSNANLVVVEG